MVSRKRFDPSDSIPVDAEIDVLTAEKTGGAKISGELMRIFRDEVSEMQVYRGQKNRKCNLPPIEYPHKPLMLLLAIRSAALGAERLLPFNLVESELLHLLGSFSPGGASHPEYPFIRLRSQRRIWEIASGKELPFNRGGDVSAYHLRTHSIRAGLRVPFYQLFTERAWAATACRFILRTRFLDGRTRFMVAEQVDITDLVFE